MGMGIVSYAVRIEFFYVELRAAFMKDLTWDIPCWLNVFHVQNGSILQV
jgi:hypothetical protein